MRFSLFPALHTAMVYQRSVYMRVVGVRSEFISAGLGARNSVDMDGDGEGLSPALRYRHVTWECRQAWLYPTRAGMNMGFYTCVREQTRLRQTHIIELQA
jgi:hypothetical protein